MPGTNVHGRMCHFLVVNLLDCAIDLQHSDFVHIEICIFIENSPNIKFNLFSNHKYKILQNMSLPVATHGHCCYIYESLICGP